MKKVLLGIVLFALSLGAYAQIGSKSIMPKLGYQTEFKRFGLGVEGRYFLTNNLRLAPGLTLWVPKDKTVGLDVDVNVHYVFPIENGLSLYPFVGGAMLNNRTSSRTIGDTKYDSTSWTNFGFNIGGGAQYDIMDNNYLNFEFKYTFTEGKDPAFFMFGYGMRF